jgi:hypothetical protein
MNLRMITTQFKKNVLAVIFLMAIVACHTAKSDFKLICDNAKKYKPARSFRKSPFYIKTENELKTHAGRVTWEALSSCEAKIRYEIFMGL